MFFGLKCLDIYSHTMLFIDDMQLERNRSWGVHDSFGVVLAIIRGLERSTLTFSATIIVNA